MNFVPEVRVELTGRPCLKCTPNFGELKQAIRHVIFGPPRERGQGSILTYIWVLELLSHKQLSQSFPFIPVTLM